MECLHKDFQTTNLFSQSCQLGNWHKTLILPGIPEFRGIMQPPTYYLSPGPSTRVGKVRFSRLVDFVVKNRWLRVKFGFMFYHRWKKLDKFL